MDSYLSALKALADETRLRIVAVLATGPFHVSELVGVLGVGQSRVSRHLKILLDAGLVRARREGTWAYYRLSDLWTERTKRGGGANGAGGFLSALARELAASDSPRARRDREAVHACLLARRRESARFFRGVAGEWDARRDSVEGPPAHLDALVGALSRNGSSPVEVLVDLGTGTGVLLSRLSTCARRVIGIDAAPEMLEFARRHVADEALANVELRLGALEHLPLCDGEADAMVANMVLHHVASPPEALAEVRRGLRSRGRLLLADYAAHSEESFRERIGDLWLGFERADLERWLDEAGFEVESVEELPARARRPGVRLVCARRRS